MIEFAPLANNSIPTENLPNFAWIWISPCIYQFLQQIQSISNQIPFCCLLICTYPIKPHIHTSKLDDRDHHDHHGHNHEVEDDRTSFMMMTTTMIMRMSPTGMMMMTTTRTGWCSNPIYLANSADNCFPPRHNWGELVGCSDYTAELLLQQSRSFKAEQSREEFSNYES